MADHSFILNYWQNQSAILAGQLSQAKKEITPATIHDIRVSIKKFRSALQLYYRAIHKKGWKKAIRNTEIMFKILGKHRELDMNLQLLEKMTSDGTEGYTIIQNIYQHSLADAGVRLEKALADYHPTDLIAIGEDIKTNLENNTIHFTATLKKLLKAEVIKIKKRIPAIQEQPHETRKQLKTFYYWLQLLPPGYVIKQPAAATLERLLDQLGNWHDTDFFRLQLKKLVYLFIPSGTDEFDSYQQLIKKLTTENKHLLRKIAAEAASWRKDL